MTTPNNNPVGSIGGIEYEELKGSGEISGSQTDATGSRTFMIDWNDRVAFFKALLGYTESTTTSSGTTYYIHKASRMPGWPALKCDSVKIKPFGKPSNSNGNPTYPFAKVTAAYKFSITEDSDTDSDTAGDDADVIASQQMDFTLDFFEYDRFELYWSGSIPIAEKIQERKRMPIIIHTYTETKVPNLLNKKTFLANRMGRVNSSAYRKVDAGHLLYLGAKATREITSDGTEAWQLTHTFQEKPDAIWNKIFRTDTNQYEYVYDKDGNQYDIYEEISFSGIISSDS